MTRLCHASPGNSMSKIPAATVPNKVKATLIINIGL